MVERKCYVLDKFSFEKFLEIVVEICVKMILLCYLPCSFTLLHIFKCELLCYYVHFAIK